MDFDGCDLLCLDLERAEGLRLRRPAPDVADGLAARAQALADPLRVAIAMALADDELCVCDLAWIVERSDTLVGHHVRLLRRAGLVSGRKDKKMLMCRLTESGRALLGELMSVQVAR